jgi:hypothetical protein
MLILLKRANNHDRTNAHKSRRCFTSWHLQWRAMFALSRQHIALLSLLDLHDQPMIRRFLSHPALDHFTSQLSCTPCCVPFSSMLQCVACLAGECRCHPGSSQCLLSLSLLLGHSSSHSSSYKSLQATSVCPRLLIFNLLASLAEISEQTLRHHSALNA